MENQVGIPGWIGNRAWATKWAHVDIVSFLTWGCKTLRLGCDLQQKRKGSRNHPHPPFSLLCCDELAQEYTAPFARRWLSGSFKGDPLQLGGCDLTFGNWNNLIKNPKQTNEPPSFRQLSEPASLHHPDGAAAAVLRGADPDTLGGTRRELNAEGQGSFTGFGFSNWWERQEKSVQIQLFASYSNHPSFPWANPAHSAATCPRWAHSAAHHNPLHTVQKRHQ